MPFGQTDNSKSAASRFNDLNKIKKGTNEGRIFLNEQENKKERKEENRFKVYL